MGGRTIVTWHVTDTWDVVLAGALVEARGLRGFRKSSDQSCRLDALLISHHTSLDAAAAQESVTQGEQPQPCPVFYVPPGLPPPSPRLSLPVHSVPGAGQRFHAELLPQEGHLQGAQGPAAPRSKVAMHKEGGNRIYSAPRPRLAAPPFRHGRGGASPDPPCTHSLQVFSVPHRSVRVLGSQFPISTRAGKREES